MSTTQANAPINTHIENGRLAKGAKSPAGLARSARNATKHGLSGRSFCLLSNEDPQQFAELRAQYFAALNPRDAIEVNFVSQFVEAFWLQQRCSLFIAETLSQEIAEQRELLQDEAPGLSEMDLAVHASATLHDRSNLITTYERYRSTHTRNMLRFHSALIRHRTAFGATASLPTSALAPTPDSIFLPGTLATNQPEPEPEPEPQPQPETTPLTPNESTNYETNPLPPPPPPLKFFFLPDPPPSTPHSGPAPANEAPETNPTYANRKRIV